jgi:hypothetical protein
VNEPLKLVLAVMSKSSISGAGCGLGH